MDGVHVLKGWTDPAMPSSAHPDTECQVVDGSHFFPYDTWRHLSKNSFQCLLNAFYTSFVSYLKWKIITTRGVSTKKDLAPCIVNQVTWHLVCGSGQWRQTQQSMALACPSFWEVNKTRIVLVVVYKAFFSCCPSFLLCQLPLHNSAFSQYIKKIRDNMLHGGNFCKCCMKNWAILQTNPPTISPSKHNKNTPGISLR